MTALRDHADVRLRRLGVALAGVALAAAGTLAHGVGTRQRWEARAPVRRAAVQVIGSGDLALSSTSRWLRHPSLAEPGAPFADGPGVLDQDPAGGLVAPPRSHYERVARGAGMVIRVRPAGGPPVERDAPADGPGQR